MSDSQDSSIRQVFRWRDGGECSVKPSEPRDDIGTGRAATICNTGPDCWSFATTIVFRSNFRLAARMRLRHVRRTAHLGHDGGATFGPSWAVIIYLGSARPVAAQQPSRCQERDGYGRETSHTGV